MKKCLVVYNPNSGKYNKEVTLPKIEKILNEYDYSVIIEKTKYKGDATSIVANIDKCDLVVSIGGDGTFNEVMTGNFMRKDRIVLCHLPSGTTNDVGAMWGADMEVAMFDELSSEDEKKKWLFKENVG